MKNLITKPAIHLETDRLLLTPLSNDDFTSLWMTLVNSYVREYLCDGKILSEEEVHAMLDKSIASFRSSGYGLWSIVARGANQYVGIAGLWSFFEEGQPQLLYALLPDFTHRGYATEAAACMIKYAFAKLDFNYLDASFDKPNISSQRVCERLGMEFLKEELVEGKPLIFYRKKKVNNVL